jgi:hypothetical protein
MIGLGTFFRRERTVWYSTLGENRSRRKCGIILPTPSSSFFCKSGGCNVRQTLFSLGRPAWPRGLVMREGDVFKLQKVLGHATMQITQHYTHLSSDVYAEEWGRLVDVVPREAEVLPFAGSAKEEEG